MTSFGLDFTDPVSIGRKMRKTVRKHQTVKCTVQINNSEKESSLQI